MSEAFPDTAGYVIEESGFVEKFEGEPSPETLFERVHFIEGKIVMIEKIVEGEVVSTEYPNEGGES